jgi:hypothetical protein
MPKEGFGGGIEIVSIGEVPKGFSAKTFTSAILEEAQTIQISPEDRDAEGRLLSYMGGPKSNLNEKNWKMVRTQAFKEKFGNWTNYRGMEQKSMNSVMSEIIETSELPRQKKLAELMLREFKGEITISEGVNPNGHMGTTEPRFTIENQELKITVDFLASESDIYYKKENYYETILHESLHVFTTHAIHLIEDEHDKQFSYLLNKHETAFYEKLKEQMDFFLKNTLYPDSYRWVNTHEFLAYFLTSEAEQKAAEEMHCEFAEAASSEYTETSNNLLNAIYNTFKKYLHDNQELAVRLQSGFSLMKDKLDENGEPRIVS